VDLPEEVEIDPPLSNSPAELPVSALAEIERLVAADVEQPAGEVRKELVEQALQQPQ